jgi:hypothetical protein
MLDLIGGPDRDRTDDLFHAIAPIKCTFNNLQAAGDCQPTRKYAEDGHLTGDFTGEKNERVAWVTMGREDSPPTLCSQNRSGSLWNPVEVA